MTEPSKEPATATANVQQCLDVWNNSTTSPCRKLPTGFLCMRQPEEIARMKAELDRGREAADPDISPLWCGAGVGLIHSVQPAEDLVRGIVADVAAVIAKLGQHLAPPCSSLGP